MEQVYVETSIVSYLRQRPSGQVVAAARQLLTHRWWNQNRREYDVVTSQYVLDEAGRGDPALAADRLNALRGIPLLDLPDDVPRLADEILAHAVLPPQAQMDALHIATATFHQVDYLLTWNCKHIANAQIISRVHGFLRGTGLRPPTICTPEEMIGGEYDES